MVDAGRCNVPCKLSTPQRAMWDMGLKEETKYFLCWQCFRFFFSSQSIYTYIDILCLTFQHDNQRNWQKGYTFCCHWYAIFLSLSFVQLNKISVKKNEWVAFQGFVVVLLRAICSSGCANLEFNWVRLNNVAIFIQQRVDSSQYWFMPFCFVLFQANISCEFTHFWA